MDLKSLSVEVLEKVHDEVHQLAKHWKVDVSECVERLIAAGLTRYLGGAEADRIAKWVAARIEGDGAESEG